MALKERIREVAESVHNGNAYADNPERLALRRFVKYCPEFQRFWRGYFGDNGCGSNAIIKDDPLGKKHVDLGIVDRTTSEIYGLVEVDVLTNWNPDWPGNYRRFNVLKRKLRYFQSNNYKYITCSLSLNRKKMVCTTRENIQMCYSKYGVTRMKIKKWGEYDEMVRCPLDNNIKWFEL